MAIRNPRSRTISICLSEEEYLRLKRICLMTGARSVSDLCRDAMRVILESPDRDDLLALRMDEFRSMLKALERKVDELNTRLRESSPGR